MHVWQITEIQNIERTLRNQKETATPAEKWVQGLNRHFTKEDAQRANKCVKKCSASVLVKNEFKTKMRCHMTPLDGLMLKWWTIPVWQKRWSLFVASGNVNCTTNMETYVVAAMQVAHACPTSQQLHHRNHKISSPLAPGLLMSLCTKIVSFDPIFS